MVHLQGVLTLRWVPLVIVLVSSVPQSGALVKCWTFERWDLVGGPWITGGENHETPGFFPPFVPLFPGHSKQFLLLCLSITPSSEGKGN